MNREKMEERKESGERDNTLERKRESREAMGETEEGIAKREWG